MTDELDKVLDGTRTIAKGLGFQFPDVAPAELVLGPQKHTNHLAYKSLPSFNLPFTIDILDGCKNLTSVSYQLLQNYLIIMLPVGGY